MDVDSNWILVIVTAVYTIATVAICIANWKSASAAKRQAEEMTRQYQDSIRARIAIRFDKKCPTDRNIVLKNVGKQDADGVRLTVDREFMEELNKAWPENLLKVAASSTIHIAAGQEFWVFVGFASTIDRLKTTNAKLLVRYRAENSAYEETAEIDFSQYNFIAEISSKTVSANGHHWTS